MMNREIPIAWAARADDATVWLFTDSIDVARRALRDRLHVIPLFYDRELTKLAHEALQQFCFDVQASKIHSRRSIARGIALRAKEMMR